MQGRLEWVSLMSEMSIQFRMGRGMIVRVGYFVMLICRSANNLIFTILNFQFLILFMSFMFLEELIKYKKKHYQDRTQKMSEVGNTNYSDQPKQTINNKNKNNQVFKFNKIKTKQLSPQFNVKLLTSEKFIPCILEISPFKQIYTSYSQMKNNQTNRTNKIKSNIHEIPKINITSYKLTKQKTINKQIPNFLKKSLFSIRLNISDQPSSIDNPRENIKKYQKLKKKQKIRNTNIPNVSANNFIVTCAQEQKIICSNNPYSIQQIASLSKIMTFYTIHSIVQRFGINIYQQKIVIDQFVLKIEGTSAELEHEEIFTIQQLLYGLMLPSGNDAALALAGWAGSLLLFKQKQKQYKNKQKLIRFIKEMNLLSKNLNLQQSKWHNPHGLTSFQNKSTVFDMSRLCVVCLRIPLFKKIISTKIYRCKVNSIYNERRSIEWENTNRLLWENGYIGIKTGVTSNAGPCLATAYILNNLTIIVIVLRSKSLKRRFKDTSTIIRWLKKEKVSELAQLQQTKSISLYNISQQ